MKTMDSRSLCLHPIRLRKKFHLCRRGRVLALIALLGSGSGLLAQKQTSAPTDHWVYDYAQQLALRHRWAGLHFDHFPLTLGELAFFSDTVQAQTLSAAEKFWLQRLQEHAATPRENRPWLQTGGRLTERAGKFGGAARSVAALRTHAALFPDRHVALVNAIRIDQDLRDDPTYLGKRWRGFAGYTEQAYAALHFDKYLVKFGRDFLRWGRGYDASLLLSDEARPLDQLYAGFKLKHLQFHYVAAKLNPVALDDSSRWFYRRNFADRYFAAVRAEVIPSPSLLKLAVTQMVLYAGPERGFEWYYLNPLLIYHGEQLNEPRKGNTFWGFDFVLRPHARAEIYGQFLLDDHQIEKTRTDDLEPTEYGVMLGGVVADPLQWSGATLGGEYTRVANRTYNTLNLWEKFTHRNRPLAHFLGNDFDRVLVYGQVYAGANVQLIFSGERRRRGEGRVDSTFATPWRDLPAGEVYRESFPSGIVERSTHFDIEARWHPQRNFYLSFAAGSSRYRDYENQAGIARNETRLFLRLWLEKFWWAGLN